MAGKTSLKRFLYLTDIHWGFERKGGKRVPIHAPKALDTVHKFACDFGPDVVIWGGDNLDCAAISHHNRDNARAIEGLRIQEDAAGFKAFRKAIAQTMPASGREVLFEGNHEDWLNDLVDKFPGLEGLLDLRTLVGLPDDGVFVPQGGTWNLGKLWFLHGDVFKGGGANVAKKAVETYGRSVRFGHFHRFEAFTKHSALDARDTKTGMAIPCLCTRSPGYGKGAPNQWSQGFLYGWVHPNGTFTDVPVILVDGHFTYDGRIY